MFLQKFEKITNNSRGVFNWGIQIGRLKAYDITHVSIVNRFLFRPEEMR